ncbi:hypothetical protein N7463_001690 [Penicillium fimorum]|uniref:Uncharacterized protein n=1 Tax=Penicillium fimorum TaxID=1882269 RepID=A0A9W9XXP3_9EURO|nr:hypothetical protein N7463_001690 [Penicillium fimorum]
MTSQWLYLELLGHIRLLGFDMERHRSQVDRCEMAEIATNASGCGQAQNGGNHVFAEFELTWRGL